MRIIHVHNLMNRKYGLFNSTYGKKINNGFVQNNHYVLEFSDRDIVRNEAFLKMRWLGYKAVNQKLIETCINFEPDILVLGHTDLIVPEAIARIRALLPKIKIAHWSMDALFNFKNIERLNSYQNSVDSIFITSGFDGIKQFKDTHKFSFIPNPCDIAIEAQNNSLKVDFETDLLFCGRGDKEDYRYSFVKELQEKIPRGVNFKTFGLHGGASIFGTSYDSMLKKTKMGLNLNRQEGWPLYSSDRIAQLVGNGVLTFLWDKGCMRSLLSDTHAVYFNSLEDLAEKIEFFQENDLERQRIAEAGYNFYQKEFSSKKVASYIIQTMLGEKYTEEYFWHGIDV